MFLGLDIGTSGVKAVLVDESQQLLAQSTAPMTVSRPHPDWSEQDPESWWQACVEALGKLEKSCPDNLKRIEAIGLSGQMHGATLLDRKGQILRPAILWNDGRSASQCAELEQRAPELRQITGNLAMPGFTAPKLLWIEEHEPEVFQQIDKVLLPKDYIRYRLSGSFGSDMSDAAGTLWLDVGGRKWSETMLEACNLHMSQMPDLYEGSEQSAELSAQAAQQLGLNPGITIAGGGGDNACGAVGIGAVQAGQSFISLGTSGVYFVANARFSPNPDQGMHAFCHALPHTWHQMGVTLSAASCLDWVAKLTAAASVEALMTEIETQYPKPANALFLPYLSGERTPHNNPNAKGVFFGLSHETTRAELGRAVLEGVAFAFADAQQALLQGGANIGRSAVIGGGSRSQLWGEILASVLQRPLDYFADGEFGPAFGASRLARLAHTGESVAGLCNAPAVTHTQLPNDQWLEHYSGQLTRYRELYHALKDSFTYNQPAAARAVAKQNLRKSS
jgi:xylulokinase